MWQAINLVDINKWIKVDETNGKILGRVYLKEGEYKASKLVFDEAGLGSKNYLGSYATLAQAQAAVDA